jgi:dTDP-glucose pyrophosphorylase
MKNQDKLSPIQIDSTCSMLEAIQLMDRINRKLLIVNKEGRFLGLISIGDIQRAIINNIDVKNDVNEVLRQNIQVGHINDDVINVKEVMLKNRTEFMPILDDDKKLVDVIFWEDIFEETKDYKRIEESIPVVIMAGGKGSRLKPITNIIPKPLVPVGERAFVEIIMDSFKSHGLDQFLFSVNYKSDLIKYYFDNHEKEYKIDYFHEDKPLGTAGSLTLMKDHIKSTFFISNCDIIVDQDYSDIYNYHKENKNELTAVAAIKTYNIPYGTMEIGNNGLLEKLVEKPENTYYVNAGLYILEPHLLDEIPDHEFFHITHLMELIMKRKGKVGVFPVSEGAWMDIGVWNNYSETQKKFNSRFK